MAASIWLAHVTVYDATLPGEKTLYFSSSNFVTGTTGLPPNGVAHTYYDPRISQPMLARRDIFDAATTFGASKVSYGTLDLINNDGGLDELKDYGFDGRKIVIITGTVGANSGGVPTWSTTFTGTMEQPEISTTKASIRIRDRQYELDILFAKNTYGGTNSLPNGLDGVATDLKGKVKPKVYGKVFQITPELVNTSRYIYQVNDGAISTVDAAYDRGAAYTKGADYTSQSDMETNAPASGGYRVWPAGGYFRTNPAGTPGLVTCDVTEGTTAADRTLAQIVKRIIVNEVPTMTISDISSSDLTALDTATSSAVIGIYVNNGTVDTYSIDKTTANNGAKVLSVIEELCKSFGTWFGFDTNGLFRIKQFTGPSGSPTLSIAPEDIIKFERIASNDPGKGIPIYKVGLKYSKYYTTIDTDVAASVAITTKNELKQPYRQITPVVDTSIQTKHKLAGFLTFETLITDATVATNEATRLLNLYKPDHDMYQLRVAITDGITSYLDLGNTIMVQLNRFGLSAGANFIIIGIQIDARLKIADLTIWK